MYREITISQFIHEIMNKIRFILIGTLLIAILFTAYSCFDLKRQSTPQKYGAYGELYIVKEIHNTTRNELNDISSIEEAEFYFRDIIPMLTGNEVLGKVLEDPSLQASELSIEELRKMIYIREKYDNRVINISVVSENKKLARTICECLIKYGVEYFHSNDFIVEVRVSATSLGAVSLEAQESKDVQGEKIYIVQPTANISLSAFEIVKRIIVGLIFGGLICTVIICIRFIFDDKIVYWEQIPENIELLCKSMEKEGYLNLCSALFADSAEKQTISFVNSGHASLGEKFVEEFIKLLSTMGKNVLVLEYTPSVCKAMDDSFTIKRMSGYSKAKIADAHIMNNLLMQQTIEDVKRTYDVIFLKCDDINAFPLGKLAAVRTDKAVFIVESGKTKIKELREMYKFLVDANVTIVGSVFLSDCKKEKR